MISLLVFILGFVALWKGGEHIVEGASSIARRFAIPEIIIGLTRSIGTSLPELVVNVIASINQESIIVFGNIVGSNISNTLLILDYRHHIPISFTKNTYPKRNSSTYLLFLAALFNL